VVGAGNGGLVAACTAIDAGASVCVLEKGSTIAMAKEAIGAIGSRYQKAGGFEVSVPRLIKEADTTQSGDVNSALYRTWAEKSGEMMDWLGDTIAEEGLELVVESAAPDPAVAPEAYYPPICHNSFGGTVEGQQFPYQPDGPNYGAYCHLTALQDHYTNKGGVFAWSTPGQQLVQDSTGRVTGVIGQDESGNYVQFNANKGVIICTGGYAANNDMREDLAPESGKYVCMSSATTEEGDGIRMALWAGAGLEPNGACMIWNRAIMNDTTTFGPMGGGTIFLPGSQPFLHVNQNGERFCNEDKPYPMAFSASVQQPGHYSWEIWDASYWEDIQQFATTGCSRLAPAPSGTAMNADVYDCEAMTKEHLDSFWLAPSLESGALKKCDTLEELAEAMGMDATAKETFLDTVARYNTLVASGTDTDYGKEAYRMSAVDQGPFYAAKMSGVILCSMSGIFTNTNSQAITDEGKVIDGLYVCGNDQGGFYPRNYPSQLIGMNMGRVCTFARIAAKHALGVA